MEEEERAAMEAAAAEKADRGPRKRKGGGFTAPEVTDDNNAALSQAQILALARKQMKSQIKKYVVLFYFLPLFDFCYILL